MKTSNKILLILFALFLGTVTTLALTLRIRVDRGWGTTKINDDQPYFKEVPLGTFTRLSVENFSDLNIRQGDSNSIRVVAKSKGPAYYSISGDTLKIDGGHGEDFGVELVVKDLKYVRLKNSDRINFSKLNSDSLRLESDGGYVELDSDNIAHLGLAISNGTNFHLSNSQVPNLYVEMKGDETGLYCKNNKLGTIAGQWADDITLNLDAATLGNGISKIVHLP
jgi:hypothetical protein